MTWHFVNSTYSQEPGAESSAESFSDMSLCAPSNWRHTLGLSCSSVSEMESCPGSPCGTMSAPSTGTPGEDVSMSSAAASPARTSVAQGRAQGSTAPEADCGPSSPGSSERSSRLSFSSRTAPCLFPEDLSESLGTLPRWGSMRNGELSARTMPGHLTSGTGSGYWPTPTSDAYIGSTPTQEMSDRFRLKGSSGSFVEAMAARMWPTPLATDGSKADCTVPAIERRIQNGQTVHLAMAVRMLPTPTARDWKSGKGRRENGHTPQLPEQVGGQLNPPWVEWLMGWPIGWTDLKPLAMDRFQQWPNSHGTY